MWRGAWEVNEKPTQLKKVNNKIKFKKKNRDHKEKESPHTVSGRIKQEGHGKMHPLPLAQMQPFVPFVSL